MCTCMCARVCIYTCMQMHRGVCVWQRKTSSWFLALTLLRQSLLLSCWCTMCPRLADPWASGQFSHLCHLFCQRRVGRAAVSRHIWVSEVEARRSVFRGKHCYPPCHLLTHSQLFLRPSMYSMKSRSGVAAPEGHSVFILGWSYMRSGRRGNRIVMLLLHCLQLASAELQLIINELW